MNELLSFDPTDSDGAIQLAYAALDLARLVQRALVAEGGRLKMGRDIANSLGVKVITVAQKLKLLPFAPSSTEINALFDSWWLPAPPDSAKVGEQTHAGNPNVYPRREATRKIVGHVVRGSPIAEPLGACTRCGHAPPYHHGMCPYNAAPIPAGEAKP